MANLLKKHFPRYPHRIKLSYYGEYAGEVQDAWNKRELENALVDKHNKLINTFKTQKENDDFYNAIIKEIKNIIHETN